MPLYQYQCPSCGTIEEHIEKKIDEVEHYCTCGPVDRAKFATRMVHVLGTPSAPQWNCSTSHSRSKGF